MLVRCASLWIQSSKERVYAAHLSKQLYNEYTKNNCLIGPNFLSKDLEKTYCYLDRCDVPIEQCLFALIGKILVLEWHVFVRPFIETNGKKLHSSRNALYNLNLIIYDSRTSQFKFAFSALIAPKQFSVFILWEISFYIEAFYQY